VDGLSGAVRIERVAFPAKGGVYDQPARTMEALEVMEGTAYAVVSEQIEERRAKGGADARRSRAKPRPAPPRRHRRRS
jgi:hypothetical protein